MCAPLNCYFQMSRTAALFLSLLVLSYKANCGFLFDEDLAEESKDFSEWHDPTDMVNYDLAAGRMREVLFAMCCDKRY